MSKPLAKLRSCKLQSFFHILFPIPQMSGNNLSESKLYAESNKNIKLCYLFFLSKISKYGICKWNTCHYINYIL